MKLVLVRCLQQNVLFASRSFCRSTPKLSSVGGGWQHWFGPARKAGDLHHRHDGHGHGHDCLVPFPSDLARWMARVLAPHRNYVSGQQLIRHLDATKRLTLSTRKKHQAQSE